MDFTYLGIVRAAAGGMAGLLEISSGWVMYKTITYFGTGQVDVCSMGVFPIDVLFEHQIMTLGAMYLTIGNPSAVLGEFAGVLTSWW